MSKKNSAQSTASVDFKTRFYNIATKLYFDVDYPAKISIPIYAIFYVVMSQYFKNCKIRFGGETRGIRMSFFLIMPSRSGKGQLYKAAAIVAKALGLKVAVETDITDAGLLGSIDDKAVDYNYRNKLSEGDKGWKDPIIRGDIFNYDIIFFREVKKLLATTPSKNTEMLLSILQEGLDEPGYVRKKLKSRIPVEGTTSFSVVATTYHTPEISYTISKQGFFQRIPLYYRDFSIEEIRRIRKEIIKYYTIKTKENIDSLASQFALSVSNLKRDRTLELDKSAELRLNEITEHYCDMMKKFVGEKLKVLISMSQLAIDETVKGAAVNACLRDSDIINRNDIDQALKVVRACINTVFDKVELVETITPKDKTLRIRVMRHFRKLEKKYTNITKTMLINSLMSEGITKSKADNILERMKEHNYILTEKGDKNSFYLKLNPEI